MTNVTTSIIEESVVKSKASHNSFWLMMIGFMGLIFVRNIFGIGFPISLLLIYVCAMAFFCDHDEFIALAISFIPFSAAFQYRYALLALMVIYLAKFPKSIKKFSAFIPVILMMVWELCHVFIGTFSIVSFLHGFSELIFLSFIMSLGRIKFDYSFIIRAFSICVALSCFILLLKLLRQVDYSFLTIFSDGSYRLGINDETAKSYVMNYNANALGFMCNMTIAGVVLKIKKDGINWVDLLLVFVLAFFGLLTLSRSFIICLLFLALLFIFGFGRSLGGKIKTLFIATIAFVFSIVIVNSFAPYVLNNIIERFNADDVSNGRNELFAEYFDVIFSSFENAFFGVGLQDGLSKVHAQGFTYIENVPHNAIQELIVLWGLIGSVLFVTFIYVLIVNSFENNKRLSFANWIPFLLMFLMIQSGQLITSGSRLLMFLLIYITLSTEMDVRKTDEIK